MGACISAILSAWASTSTADSSTTDHSPSVLQLPMASASASTSTADSSTTDHSPSVLQLPMASASASTSTVVNPLTNNSPTSTADNPSMGACSSAFLSARASPSSSTTTSTSISANPTPNNSATSTALYPPTNSCYEVFLSHRGPDTKKTFASYVYRRLVLHGFRVFWDKEEMQVGDTLTSQIQAAIQTASVHVAIFSPGYAESKWCLDELHLMLESGKPIIPVFYHVHPTDLRWTQGKGVYAEALRILENKRTQDSQPRYSSTTIEKWRAALSTVSEISGLELDKFNGDEGELLDKVVESVSENLKTQLFDVAEYPIGLDQKIEDFENRVLLQRQSGKAQVIGIVGLGGIGKTTLVQEFFNRKSSHYPKSCFLSDVRENARKNSLESLQRKLLKSLTLSDPEIGSVGQGAEMLRKRVSFCKALVILDDVDHADQLSALLRPILDVLDPNSLILITSRDKTVLTSSRVKESSIYKLTGLNPQYSKQLFCLHAFTQDHPLPGFEDLVDKYLRACDGLPLSLKVFGAHLYGDHEKSFWEDSLERLQEILPDDIKKRLQISYDALQIDEKWIFLDIACFFIGENRDKAIRIWDGSGWKGSLGFRSLLNKSLVEVESSQDIGSGIEHIRIRMHDHLRDLGRDLAKDPGLPRRIWRREDMDDLLHQSSVVMEVRGISMDRREYEDVPFSGCKMKNLQLLAINGGEDLLKRILSVVHSPNLIWLRWHNCGRSSLHSWIPMKKLRVLEVKGSNLEAGYLETLWQEEQQAPLQLRELHIHAFLYDVPKSIGLLKHLEWFVVRPYFSGISENFGKLPEEFCNLDSLKHLQIEASPMRSLPHSFGNLTNLQSIVLTSFRSLEGLPDSFGSLTRLKHLQLFHCSSLTMSSESFRNISTLEHIDISFSDGLAVLPSQLAHQRSLETLVLNLQNLTELPSDIGELRNLKKLDLKCNSLNCLPESLGRLNQLTELSIKSMKLVEIRTLPNAVVSLELECPNLIQLKGLCGLAKLQRLSFFFCRKLSKLEGLCGLAKLQKLILLSCQELEELPSIETLVSLEELHLSSCWKLTSVTGFARLTKLREISVYMCLELKELVGVEHLRSLESLTVTYCDNLQLGEGVDPRCIKTQDWSGADRL